MGKLLVAAPKFKKENNFANGVIKDESGSSFNIKLKGTLFMPPRLFEHEEYGESYKFGVKFDEDDMKPLDQALVKTSTNVGDDWTGKFPHDDGSIFFKLKPNPGKTKFTSPMNVPIKPSKLDNDLISPDMDVTVHFGVSAWYQKEEKKYGLTIKIKKIWFGDDAEPKKKKSKKQPEPDTDTDAPPQKKSKRSEDSD